MSKHIIRNSLVITLIVIVGIFVGTAGVVAFGTQDADVKCVYNANFELISPCNIQTDDNLAVFFVEGKKLSSVNVKLNGVDILVPATKNKQFLFSTYLENGSNEIIITAYDAKGNKLKEFWFTVQVKV